MNSILDSRSGMVELPEYRPSTMQSPQVDLATHLEQGKTTELVVRLPDRWCDARENVWSSQSEFRVVRYLGPLPDRAMLGEYGLDLLVDGPIRSIVAGISNKIPTGITTYLALSCALDQIRALFDATRSWAPGALYRLSVRMTRSESAYLVEVEGSPDLEGRAFLPRELLEQGDNRAPIAGRGRASSLAAVFSDSGAPSRVETLIRRSGAWIVRFRSEHDIRDE